MLCSWRVECLLIILGVLASILRYENASGLESIFQQQHADDMIKADEDYLQNM